MGRCKDCKWWNRIKNTHFGDCNTMCPDPNAEYIYTEVGIDILEFGENFGCIHFERRE